jgi:hypothetical protein
VRGALLRVGRGSGRRLAPGSLLVSPDLSILFDNDLCTEVDTFIAD